MRTETQANMQRKISVITDLICAGHMTLLSLDDINNYKWPLTLSGTCLRLDLNKPLVLKRYSSLENWPAYLKLQEWYVEKSVQIF